MSNSANPSSHDGFCTHYTMVLKSNIKLASSRGKISTYQDSELVESHKIFNSSLSIEHKEILLEEIRSFIKRNSLGYKDVLENQSSHIYCQHCLKAHIIKLARTLSINNKDLGYLSSSLAAKEGHNGYYLDSDSLIQIKS